MLFWIALLAYSPEIALLDGSLGKLSWIALLELFSWDCSPGISSWTALLHRSPGQLPWLALPKLFSWIALLEIFPGIALLELLSWDCSHGIALMG